MDDQAREVSVQIGLKQLHVVVRVGAHIAKHTVLHALGRRVARGERVHGTPHASGISASHTVLVRRCGGKRGNSHKRHEVRHAGRSGIDVGVGGARETHLLPAAHVGELADRLGTGRGAVAKGAKCNPVRAIALELEIDLLRSRDSGLDAIPPTPAAVATVAPRTTAGIKSGHCTQAGRPIGRVPQAPFGVYCGLVARVAV